MKIRVTFTEPILGTCPADKEIAERFVASKAPDAATMEQEIATIGVEAIQERGKTIFPKENGVPILYDYQIKGFFKDSCGMLSRVKEGEYGKESRKIKAYKKVIDGLIFVSPRMIPIEFEGEIQDCQRPLRAMTMQGERVSLVNSEEIPAGASCEFEVTCIDPNYEAAVREWLDYGTLRGIGQWRNSGKGRFTYEVL